MLKILGALANIKPVSHYELIETPHQTRMLQGDDTLSAIERRWQREGPFGVGDVAVHSAYAPSFAWTPELAEQWVDFIETTPQALYSFEVLFDVVQALQQVESVQATYLERILLLPILTWSFALLQEVFRANGNPTQPLTWLGLDNRPALRLAGTYCYILFHQKDDQRFETVTAEYLSRYHPDDSSGIRIFLAQHYARANKYPELLEFVERYSADKSGPEMPYTRALALFHLQRHDKGTFLLREAVKKWPFAYQYLTAKNPKPPKMEHGVVTVGGKDQAWYYYELFGEFWRQPNVLAWLKWVGTGRLRLPPVSV